MARTVAIPERDFSVGQFTRTVDSFPAQVEDVAVTVTKGSVWPASGRAARLEIRWGTGAGVAFELPPGAWLTKTGAPTTSATFVVTVPREADGSGGRRKRNEVDAQVIFEVFQPLRAGFNAEAR